MKNIEIIPVLSIIDLVVVILTFVLPYNPQNMLYMAMAIFAFFVSVLLLIMLIRELAIEIQIRHDIVFLGEAIMEYGEEGVAKDPYNIAELIPFSWRFDFGGISTGRSDGQEIAALGFQEKQYTSDCLVFRYRMEKNWHPITELSNKEIHSLRKSVEKRIIDNR